MPPFHYPRLLKKNFFFLILLGFSYPTVPFLVFLVLGAHIGYFNSLTERVCALETVFS